MLGCEPAGRIGWEIAFADPTLGARAERVEGRILEGGCTSSSVRYAAEAARGETPPMPPRLEAGRYGFEGRARDASCVEFAIGCVDVEVPAANGTTVVVTLAASTERALCPAAMCSSGSCSGLDAGAPDAPASDAGPLDAPRDDVPGRDAGCTLDADCGECMTCTLGVCAPSAGGESCGAGAGLCRAGACCSGCWDGVACEVGDMAAACGAGGAACAICSGATPVCGAGACAAGRSIATLALGNECACAIADDGALFCWGANLSGQLGQGTSGAGTELDVPTRVGALSTWSTLGIGDSHVCASAGAALSCWGDNMDGQIGFADLANRTMPALVASATGPWTSIDGAAVGDHTCTLGPTGTIECMGQNDYGQLGLGDNVDHPTLGAWTGAWRSLAAGHHFTCGVQSDGTLWCTGRNNLGQLGLGTAAVGTNTNVPTRVGAETTWTRVAAGDEHACALRGAGELWCWGQGADGQLGRGSAAASSAPVRAGTDADWTDLALGRAHTCGIRGGALYCWGANASGQLGLGTSGVADVTAPMRVGAASDWESVYAGGDFTCGMRAASAVYCWGSNTSGQLGLGDAAMRTSPTAVTLP